MALYEPMGIVFSARVKRWSESKKPETTRREEEIYLSKGLNNFTAGNRAFLSVHDRSSRQYDERGKDGVFGASVPIKGGPHCDTWALPDSFMSLHTLARRRGGRVGDY